MATAQLKAQSISGWDSFHEVSKEAFGFPDFYGKNMNAWIDCLTYLDEGDGMTRFHLAEGEPLRIEVLDAESFRSRLPEIFAALVESTAFVNRRYLEAGKQPLLSLVLL
jgi:RNAse (barnase) inhibitor barstar